MHRWSGHVDDATDEWLLQWRRDSAWPVSFSVAVSVRPDKWWVFCARFAVFQHAVVNWIQFQIWWIWRPQLRRDKFTCAISILSFTRCCVVCSVETLFRWAGKRLPDFAAKLFRKPCTKFHQNRPSFVEDIRENNLVSFSGHTVVAWVAVATAITT